VIRDTGWYKSSFSGPGNDMCVEVRLVATTGVGIRDSKNPAGSPFWVPSQAWVSLVTRLTRD
jgi:hypothetical protein